MDEIGRPLENNRGTDYLEVERRYQMENQNDVNYKLGEQDPNNPFRNNPFSEKQAQQEQNNNQQIGVEEEQKVPYIKGEVNK
jgi:hypothetical protein